MEKTQNIKFNDFTYNAYNIKTTYHTQLVKGMLTATLKMEKS